MADTFLGGATSVRLPIGELLGLLPRPRLGITLLP
jgi:hypothetical protein